MEMHQIRYFLAVARTGNFSRAARECHVSQPSLSQQILKLEEELGEVLFDRQQRGTTLTPAGELFLPHAKQILREVDEALRRVSSSGSVVRGRLVLGVLPTIAPYLLPRLLGPFMKAYPEAEVVVHEEVTPRIVEALQDGKMDLGLVSLPVAGAGLKSEEWFEEPLLLVLPKAHRLAQSDEVVPMRDIEREQFILMQDGHCLADQALTFCTMKGDFAPRVSCRSAQVQTLLALVEAGMGVSIVPQMAVTQNAGVAFRTMCPAPSRKIGFLWKRNRFRSLVAQRFVEWAKAYKGIPPKSKDFGG